MLSGVREFSPDVFGSNSLLQRHIEELSTPACKPGASLKKTMVHFEAAS
jgi:hypothetical protein